MLAVQASDTRLTAAESVPQIIVKQNSAEAQLLALLKEKSVCQGNFTLASGAQSDFYVDAKLTTLDPRGASLVGQVGWKHIQDTAAELGVQIDAVGGLTMGADPIALSIGIAAHAENPQTTLQTFTVRKQAKAHGRHKLIEGNFSAGNCVVVIDDVITTGGSTLQAIDAVESEGGQVAFVLVLVDRWEGGRETIEERGHKVVSLFTRADLTAANAGQQSHPASLTP
ncbi:MAG TPA: orotate phosphoribosyltransferase [Chthoniobacterales bacterium]|nr:orotate phosphoribosyltransferase [Chthoniobacterales bacterium]